MEKILISLLLLFTGIASAVSITNEFAGMKIIYSGVRGKMTISTSLANNRWKIALTDLPDPSIVTGNSQSELLIKKKFSDPNTVIIESITADGPMQSIKVNFPPGNKRSCFVRNIFVNGFVNNIKITGGDLGDFAGPDGIVYIKGDVGTLEVKGKKYNVKHSKESQLWGGNIWADIIVTGGVKKLQAKGGNIHYDNNGGSFGKLSFGGFVNLIAADGITVKTNRSDKMSKAVFGGGINSEIDGHEYQIKEIRAKGGTISSSDIKCRQIKKLSVIGQKTGKPQPFIPEGNQGIVDTYVRTTAITNYNLCNINKILVKHGIIKNSLFAIKGHAKNITLNGEVSAQKSNVENVILRAGFDGSLNYNTAPAITPQTFITSIVAGTTVELPFIVTSDDLNEKLTVYIRQRDTALDAVISNYNGQTFSGTNRWIINSQSETGMFVWTGLAGSVGINSNIIVRVRDNSVPNLYSDLRFTVSVFTNNMPPNISINPDDSPRLYSLEDINDLSWTVTVFDVDFYDELTLSYSGLDIETNQIDKRLYYAKAINPTIGWHSNVTFTVTDSEGLQASESIDVIVLNNNPPIVNSSLPTEPFICGISNSLDFQIIAQVSSPDSLTFIRPDNLPSEAVYSSITYENTALASNNFVWTPGMSNAGTSEWTFSVYNGGSELSMGKVSVMIIITNGTGLISSSVPQSQSAETTGYFEGNINKISIAGKSSYSWFVSGTQDYTPGDWQNANYIGKISNLKIKGLAVSNTFVSRKRIAINKRDEFDFNNNDVWISGTKDTN
jgi:hypothetical protein